MPPNDNPPPATYAEAVGRRAAILFVREWMKRQRIRGYVPVPLPQIVAQAQIDAAQIFVWDESETTDLDELEDEE